MKISFLSIFLLAMPLLAAEPESALRTKGDYRVRVTLTDTNPRQIASMTVAHGQELFSVPSSQFDDIRAPRIGTGYKAADFSLKANRKGVSIDIVAGFGQYPEEHAWLLSLPLKDVRRLTRQDNKTGYAETRPRTPLTK